MIIMCRRHKCWISVFPSHMEPVRMAMKDKVRPNSLGHLSPIKSYSDQVADVCAKGKSGQYWADIYETLVACLLGSSYVKL